MQYGMEIYPYERIDKGKKGNNLNKKQENRYLIYISICFISAFLISRIILINSIAPFGISILISFMLSRDRKLMLIVGIAVFFGYITIINDLKGIGVYFLLIISLMVLRYFFRLKSASKSIVLFLIIIFAETLLYKFLILKITLGVAFFISSIEILCSVPLYLIINFSRICFQSYGKKHIFTNEELISMAIGISLVVSGTWGIKFLGISIRSVLALSLILCISYVNGCAIGSAAGIAMGLIIGMSSRNMNAYISIYGLCGFIPGIFREIGKWFSALVYMLSNTILMFYSDFGAMYKLIEILISAIIFFVIPNEIYNKLSVDLNKNIKEEKLKEIYINKVKNIFNERLKEFYDVFLNVSNILNNLVDNDRLGLKNKSNSLIESLADKVCASCNMNSMCWKREAHYTYSAFLELLDNFKHKKNICPAEIERKCIRKEALFEYTEEIVNIYIVNEMWNKRISEGRRLITSQIQNMAMSINEIMKEFNNEIKFNCEVENRVTNILEKKGVELYDCICFEDKNDRLFIKLSIDDCHGRQLCINEILPCINEAILKNMCVSGEGCSIDSKTKKCMITFEEAPKFYVSTYVSRQCKDGELYNGDSYCFTKLKDGTYMAVISDGMGSGLEAGKESKTVIDIIEGLAISGFNKTTAINTANSIMTLKFPDNEKFATVDLCSIIYIQVKLNL